ATSTGWAVCMTGSELRTRTLWPRVTSWTRGTKRQCALSTIASGRSAVAPAATPRTTTIAFATPPSWSTSSDSSGISVPHTAESMSAAIGGRAAGGGPARRTLPTMRPGRGSSAPATATETRTTPGDYARLVREYCEDAARAGVRYAELELATGGRPYDCLAEAVEAASKQRDVVVRFVAGNARDLPLEIGWMMLEAARGVPEVVAIGLGGREEGFPPEPFVALFAEARRPGLLAAPHAGEAAGPASIRSALDALGAE